MIGIGPQPSPFPLARLAGPVSIAAGGLIAVHQVVGVLTARQSATDLPHALNNVLGLVALVLLLLALVGLYARQWEATGGLGLVGFLLAFAGTTLVAGDWWFEAFVGPVLADAAPALLERPPGGWLLTGGATTFTAFAIGWALFGIASLRARVFPRPASVLLIVGGVAGLLAGTPPYQVPLALSSSGQVIFRTPARPWWNSGGPPGLIKRRSGSLSLPAFRVCERGGPGRPR